MKFVKTLSLFAALAFLGLGAAQADVPDEEVDAQISFSMQGAICSGLSALGVSSCTGICPTSSNPSPNYAGLAACVQNAKPSPTMITSFCKYACTASWPTKTCTNSVIAGACKTICCPANASNVKNCMSTSGLSCSTTSSTEETKK